MSPLAGRIREARQPVAVNDNLGRTVPSGLGATSDGVAVWRIIAGAWQAAGGKAVTSTSPAGNPIAGIDLDTTDGSVAADISPVGGDAVYARVKPDSSEWIRAKLREFTGTGSITFGNQQAWTNWTVPADVTQITVDMAGAAGGGAFGGQGGRVQATIPVTPGLHLSIAVGGTNPWLDGGYSTYERGGDSSRIGTSQSLTDALAIAAGGGGAGSGGINAGGGGGGLVGTAGANPGGQGGTQTQGGNPGQMVSGANNRTPTPGQAGQGGSGGLDFALGEGGGGGGGLYGGGGGGYNGNSGGGGGGGSSKVPAGGTTTPASQAGDGYVTITYTANNHYYVDIEKSVAGVVSTVANVDLGSGVAVTRLRLSTVRTTVTAYTTIGGVESAAGGSFVVSEDATGTIFGIGRGAGSNADGSALGNVAWTGAVAQ